VSASQAGCICVNGNFFEPQDAVISVFDAGFLLGDGLFESLRASEGVPYMLDRHIMRLFSGAADLEFEKMPSREIIIEQVYRTLQRAELPDAYVRVTITRGCGGMGLAPPPGPPTVVITALPAPPRADVQQGLRVTLLEKHGEHSPKAKSTSWQQAVLARRRTDRVGADEGIYVSDRGLVLEGVTSNVFVVDQNRLLTPCVSESLPGITRSRLLELARGAGLTVLESSLEVNVLMNAEEVFVTNAVQGLRSVYEVDGRAIGSQGSEGIFTALVGLYEEDRGVMVGASR
jgi:branched-chain amino acid aminotransferase